MSTGKNIQRSVDAGSPVPTQNHSPDQSYYSLDAFYATLLSRTFKSSQEAITFCRDLCSSHGFTVKQEQSTHKNIYVYCSREGLPDSHRNPKVNPQRNRQSQRCECRWRIVLFENLKTTWEFRKSQNADAFIHNHPLLRPEDIKKEWPREVSEKIFELARQRLPTNEIRQQVREQYPDISWDDRRFYNRLSEERQKMKQRDTAMRTIRLVNLSAQICMVNAGSEDLSHYVESKLTALLEDTCKFANVNSNSINMPVPMPPFPISEEKLPSTPTSQHSFQQQQQQTDDDGRLKRSNSSMIKTEIKRETDGGSNSSNSISMGGPSSKTLIKPDDNNNNQENESKRSSSTSSISLKKSFETLPKGYLAVPIPEHTFHVKMYSQNSAGDIRRAIFDMQRPQQTANVISNPHLQYVREPRRRRSRALFAADEDNDSMDLDSPARKLSRQVASSIIDDELDDMSSQSSPSNSQSLLFAAATANNNHDINDHHHQLINSTSPYNRVPTAAATTTTNTTADVFYASNNEVDHHHHHNYLNQPQPQSSFPPTTDVYPSSGNISNTRPTMQQQQQQNVMYDSFVQQQQQQSSSSSSNNELGLMQQHDNRPHSMTFGATIPIRATPQQQQQQQRLSMDHPSLIRPTGYPTTNFAQLQSMIEENDGKQRYYSTYRDPLQQQQQASSSIPPRAAGGGGPSSSTMMTQQPYINPQQPEQLFPPSYPTLNNNNPSSSQQQSIFPNPAANTTPFMTNEQQILQQHEKRKQQYFQDQQHLYRRASGPG